MKKQQSDFWKQWHQETLRLLVTVLWIQAKKSQNAYYAKSH